MNNSTTHPRSQMGFARGVFWMYTKIVLEFDAQKALGYAKAISRPRLVGSEGEKFVADYLVDTFKGFGLQVTREEFAFSTAWWVILKSAFLVSFLLASMSFVARQNHPLLASVGAVLLLAGTLSFEPAIRKILPHCVKSGPVSSPSFFHPLLFRIGETLSSSNIVARLHPSEGHHHLYLLAHYDSKSQNMPLVVRMILIGTLVLGNVAFSLLLIPSALPWRGVSGGWIDRLITPFYLVAVISAFSLSFLKTGNESPGSIDNAAGVGVLLHLAEIISQQKGIGEKANVTFVATGAEELSLMGAFAFCQAHEEKLRQQKENAYFLNFDGTGVDGEISATSSAGLGAKFSRSGKGLLSVIKKAGQELELKVHIPRLVVGAMADHLPFVLKGLDAVTLATVSKKSLVVHTSKDTVAQLDWEGFDKIGRLACRVIERISS